MMTNAMLMDAAMAATMTMVTKPARELVAGDVIVKGQVSHGGMTTRVVVTHVETTKRGLIRTTESGELKLRNAWDVVAVEIAK